MFASIQANVLATHESQFKLAVGDNKRIAWIVERIFDFRAVSCVSINYGSYLSGKWSCVRESLVALICLFIYYLFTDRYGCKGFEILGPNDLTKV